MELARAREIVRKLGEQKEQETVGLTAEGRMVIELAVEEAQRLNHHYIGTEHILLGLLRSEGIASGILITHGLTLEKARAEARRLLNL